MSNHDVDIRTNGLLTKLNKVVDIPAPAKRIQLRKKNQLSKDPEAKKLYDEAGRTKKEAKKSSDPELFCKARNLAATASRKNFSKEVS